MEPVDHLKAIEADARLNLSSNYVELHGLDMARAHQRGEHVGFRYAPKRAKQPKRTFTEEQIKDMSFSPDTLGVVALRNGTTKPTVAFYRALNSDAAK